MTRKVLREEIMDYQTYGEQRDEIRHSVLEIKRTRRIHLGEELTFLFENAATVHYQIQEMMRAEHIVKEAAILHELETYNGLLGGKGELGCTLLLEIPDAEERKRKLEAWLPLPGHLYVELKDGSKIRPGFDPSQVGEDRLSAVQYLKFKSGASIPIAVGCDMEGLLCRQELTEEQRAALRQDLNDD